jgi:hypothetical protein
MAAAAPGDQLLIRARAEKCREPLPPLNALTLTHFPRLIANDDGTGGERNLAESNYWPLMLISISHTLVELS